MNPEGKSETFSFMSCKNICYFNNLHYLCTPALQEVQHTKIYCGVVPQIEAGRWAHIPMDRDEGSSPA